MKTSRGTPTRHNATEIAADGLRHLFPNGRGLNVMSFHVARGSVFGFLGPNGAGKTTTIRLMLGLLRPERGSIRVFGLDPVGQGEAVRMRTGVVLDEPGLYGQLSALENLTFSGRMFRMSPASIRERSERLLRDLQLFDRRHEAVRTWSRGMRQQLGIARALLHRPELLVLDEPTAGLDVAVAAFLRRAIVRLAREDGTTVFLTTHNMTEASQLCDRVGIVRAGTMLAEGTPDELAAQLTMQRLVVRGTGLDRAAAVIRQVSGVDAVDTVGPEELRVRINSGESASPMLSALLAAGATVERISDEEIPLEAAFLSLMEAS